MARPRLVDPEDIPLVVARAMDLPDVTETVARHLGGWLLTNYTGRPDNSSRDVRRRLGRILERLEAAGLLPPEPEPARLRALERRRQRAESAA